MSKIDKPYRMRRTKTHTNEYHGYYYTDDGYKAILDDMLKGGKEHYSLKNFDNNSWREAMHKASFPWKVEQKDYTTTIYDCAKKFIEMFKNKKCEDTPWVRITLENFCDYRVKDNIFETPKESTMDLTRINDYIDDGWFVHEIECKFNDGHDFCDQYVNSHLVFDIILHKMDGIVGEKVSNETLELLEEIKKIAK